jgi:acetyl-CoA acetyltransferase
MKDVAVVAYCRTGIARATRGALNQTHGIPMTAHVLRHAVERAGIDPAEVEDVVVGCGLPEGATGHNIARNAALEAGFGDAVPGMKVTDKATGASHEQEVTLDRDEGPRPDTTLAKLAALKPVYPGGTTTAGNASQLSDGAGAVVMMDADIAARRGLPILGLFRGMQLAAVAPEEMSIAIAPAIRKLMKHHQLAMSDVDLWELHEAYAVTTLYNQAQLETPWEITNVNGGAVPLGHPYGMSGIRYLGSTLLELGRRGGHRAIVGVCTAGGMSTAAYLERP